MAKLKLGVIASLPQGPEEELKKAHELGLPTCQAVCWDRSLFNDEMADRLVAASKKYDVQVTTVWVGLPGPARWNFIEGPVTIGLVPPQYREERVATLKQGADFAKKVGVSTITTHVGFIPESPTNPLYPGLLVALREVVDYCRPLGLTFCFETGQETPTTLLR
ncbi:MAG: TIM barrel protein, partial [Anaerolineae bacterium]|nr:TIM barrel protein [Anaerolineae bacterium]